jgi:hypothetical protein
MVYPTAPYGTECDTWGTNVLHKLTSISYSMGLQLIT